MTHESQIRAAILDEFGDAVEYQRPDWSRDLGAALAELDAQARGGHGLAVLIPARTDTRWFHTYAPDWELRFFRGRVRFPGHSGCAPFPSALLVMGPLARRGQVFGWDLRDYRGPGLFNAGRLGRWSVTYGMGVGVGAGK